MRRTAQLAASLKEWGWTNPVLADEAGGVIAGHARILAARQLGIAEVPVMVARGWSDAQKRAYVIADNQLALNAGWDRELLGLELGELKLGRLNFPPIACAHNEINGTTRRIAAGTVIKPIGARAVGKVVNDDRADWREAWACSPARWPIFGTPGPRPASCRTA